ncbi:hypothetical protein [Yersinia enterocolitica]|uniref:hypothetical protein n=1 Tax=Yersinia enterocolitica TaxID=630 RepID=UPI0005E95FDA|nr:hypothetical protein [Yersinia enterocolitica]EME3609700.1 hypothetical protein [Yersinia enterocolitica]MCV3311076.1 hypothetical protein [Yersinia enterocolitica]UYJ88226.1 hypothetical protein N4228_14435 [Yersinia enterocolitica]UYJ92214.1 hypothetical protein N4225_14450 [Yersinia enterocolitica]UYK07680.1 hypothetical protein N4218_07705 [Yersinia enterocolitica]
MAKSIIDLIGREEANRLMAVAVAKAAQENRDLGLPESVKVNGVWVKKYPNGRIEKVY